MTVKKRCERCGWTGAVPVRRRRCYERRFGRGSYACWGKLARPVVVKKQKEEKPMPSKVVVRPQDVAQKKLDRARKMIAEKTRQMGRLATSLREWQSKAARYAKRASMTDVEVEAERAARVSSAAARAQRTVRRGVSLGPK